MLRIAGLHITMVLAALWAAPAVAMAGCGDPTGQHSAWCPTDARLSGLSAEAVENNVFFPEGGAALDATAKAQITLLAQVLGTNAMAGTCLRLVGHSDSSGGATANAALSERRAIAVRDLIAQKLGNRAPEIEVSGAGESAPLSELPVTHIGQRRVALWAKRCSAG